MQINQVKHALPLTNTCNQGMHRGIAFIMQYALFVLFYGFICYY